MKFIHCADIHLGKYQYTKNGRYEDFFHVFREAADHTIRIKADFLLCAGDLFDSRNVTADTLSKTAQILQLLREAGIPVYATEGNHDRAYYLESDSWLDYLDRTGLIVLLKPAAGEEITLVEHGEEGGNMATLPGYRIIGLGYPGASGKKKLTAVREYLPEKDRYTILLLHAALKSQMIEDMAGVEKQVLVSLLNQADYLALGHIHKQYREEGIFNPGSLEYVHADEARRGDVKGFFEVDTEKGCVEFISVHPREHVFAEVDVSGADGQEEILSRALRALNGRLEARPMVSVMLKGNTKLDTQHVDTDAIAEAVKERGALDAEVSTLLMDLGEFHTSDTVDKTVIEKNVLREMYQALGYDERCAQRMTELTLDIKNSDLKELNPGEVADIALKTAEELL